MPSVVGKGMSSGRGREGALLCLGGGVASTTPSPSVSNAYVSLLGMPGSWICLLLFVIVIVE